MRRVGSSTIVIILTALWLVVGTNPAFAQTDPPDFGEPPPPPIDFGPDTGPPPPPADGGIEQGDPFFVPGEEWSEPGSDTVFIDGDEDPFFGDQGDPVFDDQDPFFDDQGEPIFDDQGEPFLDPEGPQADLSDPLPPELAPGVPIDPPPPANPLAESSESLPADGPTPGADTDDEIPAEFAFLINPFLPVPPEFAFLENPELPVPDEYLFLVDPTIPVPPEFAWLLPPAGVAFPAPAVGSADVEPIDPPDQNFVESSVTQEFSAEPIETIDSDTAQAASPSRQSAPPLVAVESDEPPADEPEDTTAAQTSLNQNSASSDASVADDQAVAPIIPITIIAAVEDDGGQTILPALPVSLPLPLLIFVGVASLALLASVPALLRQRTSSESVLRELALTDDLTKLANRRRLDRDLTNQQQTKQQVAVAMIDIDHFKRLNDEFGHATGDAVLQRVAATISENVRTSDVAYRYGGEEFCVLLPDVNEHEAAAVVDRVRRVIQAIEFDFMDRPVTISAGVAIGAVASASDDGDEIVERADAALYAAKNAGRNRVMRNSLVEAASY